MEGKVTMELNTYETLKEWENKYKALRDGDGIMNTSYFHKGVRQK